MENIKKYRKIYGFCFLALFLIGILMKVSKIFESFEFSGHFLFFIPQVGMAILTIWYGLKIEIRKEKVWMLGLLNLIPIVNLFVFLHLLSLKKGVEKKDEIKKEDNLEKISGVLEKNIDLEKIEKNIDERVVSQKTVFVIFIIFICVFPWMSSVINGNNENFGTNGDFLTPGLLLATIIPCFIWFFSVMVFGSINNLNLIRKNKEFLSEKIIKIGERWAIINLSSISLALIFWQLKIILFKIFNL